MVSFAEKLAEIDARMREHLADPDHEARVARITASLEADAQVQRRYRRKRSGIPVAFWPIIEAPREEAALAFVRAWLAGDKPFCILSGDLGRGKTIAMAWAIDQRGGQYVEASDICRSGWYGDQYWDDWRLAPYLALDELGMEPMDEKGWWEGKLYSLLSGRLGAGRRTLLGTNLPKADLQARYGSAAMRRLWDRLENNWEGRVFIGPSLRRAS